jgi:hypothetical protein
MASIRGKRGFGAKGVFSKFSHAGMAEFENTP